MIAALHTDRPTATACISPDCRAQLRPRSLKLKHLLPLPIKIVIDVGFNAEFVRRQPPHIRTATAKTGSNCIVNGAKQGYYNYRNHLRSREENMRFVDLIETLSAYRRRARRGEAELTETLCVRLNLQDLHNINMIRRGSGTSVTDAELVRGLLRCAAVDLLGAYDDSNVTVSREGSCVYIQH